MYICVSIYVHTYISLSDTCHIYISIYIFDAHMQNIHVRLQNIRIGCTLYSLQTKWSQETSLEGRWCW